MREEYMIEEIIMLETMLDHITGEELGLALTTLNNHPAVLDAILIQAIGKKNRPAQLLQALCRPEDELLVCGLVFRHTHALGIRSIPLKRYVLARSAVECEVAGLKVKGKQHLLDGKSYARPEADEIARLVEKTGIGAPGLRWLRSAKQTD